MSDPADTVFASIADQVAALARSTPSATALVDALLTRIERVQPTLNAFVTVTQDTARARAKEVERELGAGGSHGPLHGVPFAVKDVIDTRGIRTTFGATIFRDRVPDRDAAVVERLRAAGAVLMGKLHTAELANAFLAEAAFNGPCMNPWDPTREPGSSSSGPACAVAAGLVSFAIGSELLGSIDHPAAYCGVTGYRPTYGSVSRFGTLEQCPTMDKLGVLARRAADCRTVLAAISGPDPRDPTTVAPPIVEPRPIRGLRLGVLPMPTDVPEPAIAKAFADASGVFADAGVELVPMTLPVFPSAAVAEVIIVAEIFCFLDELIRSGAVYRLTNGKAWRNDHELMDIRGADYVKAQRVRAQLQAAYRDVFGTVDAILSHGRPNIAEKQGAKPAFDDTKTPFQELLIAGNLAGLPGITLPAGFSVGNLPVSVHLTASPWNDETLFALGEAFQRATDWHERRPPNHP